MGLTLKHVEQTKSGRWQYRRRVPKDVADAIGKGEFKSVLGDTQREALAAYPAFHASIEREITKAKAAAQLGVAAERGELSGYKAYELARTRAVELAPSGTDWGTREAIVSSIARQYEVDPATGNPKDATEFDRLTINLVRNGSNCIKRPPPTLGDAKKLYLDERRAAESVDGFARFEQQVDQIVSLARTALGRDPVLQELTREDARTVRDFMLDQFKKDGTRISRSSVARYLNGLKAVINFAVVELELPATFKSPFNSLPMPQGLGTKGHTADDKKREPFPPDVLIATRQRILTHALPELGLIWRLLQGTGCRLAEVTGLRVGDVDVVSEFPNIRVEWHEDRRLKNQSSIRHIPLVGDALTAAKEALLTARGKHVLFQRYGRSGGATAASAALMSHVRVVTTNKLHVVHSLRHNMKDWLMLAEVSSLDQNLILGHALGAVGDRVYGGTPAKLRATTRALHKVQAYMS